MVPWEMHLVLARAAGGWAQSHKAFCTYPGCLTAFAAMAESYSVGKAHPAVHVPPVHQQGAANAPECLGHLGIDQDGRWSQPPGYA